MARDLPWDWARRSAMSCPHLKEVVMLYCSGFPVKKMVPLDRIVSASPCLTQDFNGCPLYQEVLKRLQGCAQATPIDPGSMPPCMKDMQ
jgi:hypothetical protein